jgi:hypothetical protein
MTEKIEKLELAKGRVLQKLHDTFESIVSLVLPNGFKLSEGVETNEAGEQTRLPYVIEWGPMPKGTTSTKKYKLGKGVETTDWSNPFVVVKHSETPDQIGRIYLNEQLGHTISGKSLETLDEVDRFNFAKAIYSAVVLAWAEMFTTPKARTKGKLVKTAEFNELAMSFGVVNFNVLTDRGERIIRKLRDKIIFPVKSIDWRKDAKPTTEREGYKLFISPNPNDLDNAIAAFNCSKSFYESEQGKALQLPKMFESLNCYIWVQPVKRTERSILNKLLTSLNSAKDDELLEQIGQDEPTN